MLLLPPRSHSPPSPSGLAGFFFWRLRRARLVRNTSELERRDRPPLGDKEGVGDELERVDVDVAFARRDQLGEARVEARVLAVFAGDRLAARQFEHAAAH